MLAFTLPASAQTGWGVQRYEGFRADTTGNGGLNLSWSTGNLGNTYNEGEWVPYLLELKNVNINATNFTPITICYDFTAGNLDARFVDLVKGIQIGISGLGNSQGWPSDTLGSAFPMTTRAELEAAQNSQGLTSWGNEYLWANYVKLDVDTSQLNLDVNGLPGAPDASTRCFTITRADIIAAYAPNPVPNSTTFYIYFNLHLSQTFIWENSLQSQLNVDPTDFWGGYLYGNYSAFAGDSRKGSGFVSGSSGQTYLTSGNKTVPIPVPPQPAGQLAGMKYHDINGKQLQDGGEGPLDGWPIYIGTIIGGIPISDTLYTDNSGAWSATGLPQALYFVSEELDSAPTTGTNAGYTNAAPAFAQTPPSEWAQTYPDNTSTGTDITGVNTPPEAIANGYGPYSWEVNSLNNPTVAGINFGNHVPAPVCAVFPFDTTICDEDQVTLTAQRIAQGTSPYSYAWTGPNNFTANTQSIVVPASAAGTYTVTLTDANNLVSSGCSGTVSVFPVPDFEITGDTIVCELSTGNAYMPQFDVNSPVPKDSIVAWQWSISGNESVTVSQTIYELCNEFRSLTQGFYGNANGSYCGSLSLSTTGLIDSLLTAHGPLVVGDPLANGSLTIDLGKGACVVQYLPGGGTAIALAKHFAFNPNNCNIHPGGMPLKNGRFNNILLSQTITLALNLRLDTLLAQSFYLPPPKMARPDFRPDGFALHQNHPNPFNPVTTITYSLPEPSTVYLSVYNALGEEISVLVDADASAGTHSVIWNSQNARGTGSSGLFYYRIYAKGESGAVFHDQRKMMLVK